MMSHKRIRTIKQVYDFFHKRDPECAVSYRAIRNVVEKGIIPHIESGNRKLVVLEDVYEYFYNEPLMEDNHETVCLSR